jgi:hypothetical protein
MQVTNLSQFCRASGEMAIDRGDETDKKNQPGTAIHFSCMQECRLSLPEASLLNIVATPLPASPEPCEGGWGVMTVV